MQREAETIGGVMVIVADDGSAPAAIGYPSGSGLTTRWSQLGGTLTGR